MKVSVVIPVYNEEKYLAKCLQSLQNQVVSADEVIVVDNNSTDSTVEVAKRYKATILREKRQGVIFARNKGFNKARYDIIARTDADARLPKDWIKNIKKNFEEKNIDALGGPIIFYDTKRPYHILRKAIPALLKFVHNHELLYGPNFAVTKSVWEKIKEKVCLDINKVFDDFDISIHIHKEGGIVGYDSKLIVPASARRVKDNPYSFFVEYPLRTISGILNHKKNGKN